MLDAEKFTELKAAGRLPSPHGVAQTVMELCERENTALKQIVEVVRSDPALAARIIKLANSIGGRPARPVVSVCNETLIRIGMENLRQLALSLSLLSDNRRGLCERFDYSDFWSRSLAMAVSAQALGNRVRVAPVMELFSCGLFANMGRLALATGFPAAYSAVLQECEPTPDRLMEMEHRLFGIDHANLTLAMLEDWGLPVIFIEAIQAHIAPLQGDILKESRLGQLSLLLNLASRIAYLLLNKQAASEKNLIELVIVAHELGLDGAGLISLYHESALAWETAGRVLDIRTHASFPLTVDRLPPIEHAREYALEPLNMVF